MTRFTPLLLPLALLAVTGLTGCPDPYPDYVEISAVTGAPPARTAHIVNSEQERSIHLSQGVALGIRCYDTCDGACIAPHFAIADPTLLEVREAYFASATGYVLHAKGAGTTTFTVDTTCANRRYTVTITADN